MHASEVAEFMLITQWINGMSEEIDKKLKQLKKKKKIILLESNVCGLIYDVRDLFYLCLQNFFSIKKVCVIFERPNIHRPYTSTSLI